jgi:hypothetical protein
VKAKRSVAANAGLQQMFRYYRYSPARSATAEYPFKEGFAGQAIRTCSNKKNYRG